MLRLNDLLACFGPWITALSLVPVYDDSRLAIVGYRVEIHFSDDTDRGFQKDTLDAAATEAYEWAKKNQPRK
jgi:hypothetical protein